MRLYHMSTAAIEAPDVHYGRRNADFGQGFYLSPDAEFSKRWASPGRDGTAVLNEYELNTAGLAVKRLTRDEAWYRLIFDNRALKGDALAAYDVVIGPIANDTLYDTWGILTGGMLAPELALDLLRLGDCREQVVVKSERAVRQLRFVRATALDRDALAPYREAVRREEDAYQTAVALRLEKENE